MQTTNNVLQFPGSDTSTYEPISDRTAGNGPITMMIPDGPLKDIIWNSIKDGYLSEPVEEFIVLDSEVKLYDLYSRISKYVRITDYVMPSFTRQVKDNAKLKLTLMEGIISSKPRTLTNGGEVRVVAAVEVVPKEEMEADESVNNTTEEDCFSLMGRVNASDTAIALLKGALLLRNGPILVAVADAGDDNERFLASFPIEDGCEVNFYYGRVDTLAGTAEEE